MKPPLQAEDPKILKKDLFGSVSLQQGPDGPRVVRSAADSRPWARWLARRLLAREARSLAGLEGIDGVPKLLQVERDSLQRSWIDGAPMHTAGPAQDTAYFRDAARLLSRMHRRCVAHNDLAKEPNWLVTPDGRPAIVDLQLGWYAPRRGLLFRLAGREDLRHLLKHKRTYCPQALTTREREILERPALPSRIWMRTGKKVYLAITRGVLGWSDREGAGDRRHKHNLGSDP